MFIRVEIKAYKRQYNASKYCADATFSSDGTYVRSFGRMGDKQGELGWPAEIAFDKNGHIISRVSS